MDLFGQRRGGAFLPIAACVMLVAVGCGRCEWSPRAPDSGEEESAERETAGEVRAFEAPDAVDLVNPRASKRRELELGEARRYPACRDLLEPSGSVLDSFLPDEPKKGWALYGCDPEAHRRTDDGRRYVAYRLAPGPSGGRDLRFVAYDSNGERLWTYRLHRSNYTEHFAANFRSSFITPLPPHLVCVGTLWEGGTLVSCLDPESGEPEWEGDLDFWSGIPLQGHDVALHGADISGLTRRYPYSGVEMERTDFEHLGGHSAMYVTDGTRLYFAPKEDHPDRLTAYRFSTMEAEWRMNLPGHPDSAYDATALVDHEILAIKIDEHLYGLETSTGKVRWAFNVGDHRPPLAAGPDRLYLLLQRPDEASLLYAFAPDSGEVAWYGPVPTGTLEVAWVDDSLMIRSVRAFQRVRISE